jgi:hypothetical protein
VECSKKCRSEGLLVAAYNCGIVLAYREFLTHESPTQTATFYLDIVSRLRRIPKYLVYDDGCHLKSFIEHNKLFDKSIHRDLLKNVIIAVDKFHFKGQRSSNTNFLLIFHFRSIIFKVTSIVTFIVEKTVILI